MLKKLHAWICLHCKIHVCRSGFLFHLFQANSYSGDTLKKTMHTNRVSIWNKGLNYSYPDICCILWLRNQLHCRRCEHFLTRHSWRIGRSTCAEFSVSTWDYKNMKILPGVHLLFFNFCFLFTRSFILPLLQAPHSFIWQRCLQYRTKLRTEIYNKMLVATRPNLSNSMKFWLVMPDYRKNIVTHKGNIGLDFVSKALL